MRAFAAILVMVLGLAAAAPWAQESASGTATPQPATATENGFDFEAWNRLAARAEEVVTAGRASTAALEDLRAQIAVERDKLLARTDTGSTRIATLEAQLKALGPKPADGEPAEAPETAARRAELESQLAEAKARAAAIAEAFQRAEGLTAEITALIRARRSVALFEAGPVPLAPSAWAAAVTMIGEFAAAVRNEVSQSLATDARVAEFRERLPRVIVLLVLAMVLLVRARAWIGALLGWLLPAPGTEGRAIKALVQSAAEISAPLWGLLALIEAAEFADLLSLRGLMLLDAVWTAGLAFIVGAWLADQLFGDGAEVVGRKLVPDETRGLAGRLTLAIAAMIGLDHLLATIGTAMHADPSVAAVFTFVPIVGAGVLLVAAGRWVVAPGVRLHDPQTEVFAYGRRIRRTIAQALIAVGGAAPVASALGYVSLAESVIFPVILTLAIVGTALIVHRLLVGLSAVLVALARDDDDVVTGPLISLLIAVALIVLAIPVVAVAWGATAGDLAEFWARIRAGVPIGSARLTPTAALTFVVVFVVGYTLTRFVQGALRTYVFPNTNLDAGARAAIRTGTGYVGITITALIAIASTGLDLSGLAIVAGALSVGIGFGLQAIVSNFVSGLILLIERPIKEGDWVEVGGYSGYVKGVSVRSTEIETFDRATVIVPNSDLISGTVTNWTHRSDVGRVIVPVGVAYGTDTRKVEAILREIAEGHPMVLNTPAPTVIFQGFGADSLNFEIRAILSDVNWMLSTKSDMNFEIDRRFREEGIEIPFAQRDLHLRDIDRLEDAIRGRGAAARRGGAAGKTS